MKFSLITAIGMAWFLQGASAHPGEHISEAQAKREIAKSQDIAARGAEKLARCANSAQAQALRQRAINRRAAKVEALARGNQRKRSESEVESYESTSHNFTGSVVASDAFDGNTSCILEPIVTIGPYWVSGELIRQDDREDQEGVEVQLELQFIDTDTCEPVSNLYVDKWNANSTGVYSGVTDENTLDATYLRAIQITDNDGVVTFDTLIPGHYQGRATHTHIMVHQNVTAYDNGTYTGGTVRSIGQLFYETALRDAVELVAPYSTNTQEVTTNEEDTILTGATLGSWDPFVKYIYLGDGLSDGLFAWHSIGIDMSANYSSQAVAAAAYYATGGVDESGSSGFGGGSGPSGQFNGTGMPGNNTGAMPSGVVPSGGVLLPSSGSAGAVGTSSVKASALSSSGSAKTSAHSSTGSVAAVDTSSTKATTPSGTSTTTRSGPIVHGASSQSTVLYGPEAIGQSEGPNKHSAHQVHHTEGLSKTGGLLHTAASQHHPGSKETGTAA